MASTFYGSSAAEHEHEALDLPQDQLSQASPRYNYSPLQESQIRLLTIISVNATGITCELEESEFEHSPAYDALSCAWGAQDSNQPSLHCSGGSISISPHLHSALKRFYQKWENDDAADRLSRPRIWVDAICINQNDRVEKAHQVARMAQIYTHARRVIVWLGEHENESRLAMQLLQDYATAFPDIVRDESRYAEQIHSADELLHLPHGQASAGSWRALEDLFNRPYFQRRWVLQELALGNAICVLCGEDSVPWSALAGFTMNSRAISNTVDGLALSPFFNAGRMNYIRRMLAVDKLRFDIVDLFASAQGTQCTEKVDRLLSLIGILPREYEAVSVAAGIFDYHQPYWAIFLRFVQSVLQINLDPLSLAGACITRNPNLPTWCPDFTSQFRFANSQGSDYHASSGKPIFDTPRIYQSLKCRGFKLGTILDKVDGGKLPLVPSAKGCYTGDDSKEIVLWERECYDLAQRASSPNKAILDDQFSRVLIRGERELRAHPEYQHRPEPISEIHSIWSQTQWGNVSTGAPLPSSWDAVRRYGTLVVLNGYRSKFFATLEGQLGFSTSEILPNDAVYILYGGRTPFVLRRRDPITNMMCLIGDTYIEGAMYGEALTADNKQPDEW
ncbi:MAG: hypothetical protein LQ337_007510, partial [Flavoplaca oasis]